MSRTAFIDPVRRSGPGKRANRRVDFDTGEPYRLGDFTGTVAAFRSGFRKKLNWSEKIRLICAEAT